MTVLRVERVRGAADTRAFWGVVRSLYVGDPNWVPPLPGDQARAFDPRANPSLQPGRWARWVAFRGKLPVGRLAAFAPPHRPGTGYFGFFESINDAAIATALLRQAEEWLAILGCLEVFGPVAVTARDQIGLLVAGFDRPPVLLTPYNPPSYAGLLEAAGYSPSIHLSAYGWEGKWHDPDDLGRVSVAAHRAGRITIRQIDPRRLREETRTIARLVNETLADAWHYDPITEVEADQLTRDLRPVLDPALTLLAEDSDGPCGVALAVPDLNWLWRKAGGRLLPLGWFRLLRHRRQIPQLRGMALGVARRIRGGNTAARLIAAWAAAGAAQGYRYTELAQVFDSNRGMRLLLERMGLPVVRRYAVFHRSLIK